MKNIEVDSSCNTDAIKHGGIIKKIDNRFYYVSIVSQSACNGCSAKGVCNVSDLNEEVIEVPKGLDTDFKVGDKVHVAMRKELGTRAVMLGYFIPFLLIVFTLIISLNILDNQGLAGLLSVGILIPYYFLLYRSKDKLKRTFTFSIQ